MLKEITILVFALVGSYADPITPSQGILCGYAPENIYQCMGNPALVSADVLGKCKFPGTPCDKMKCLATESGWLKDGKVEKKKVSDYFESYASAHPEWSAAVNHLKASCVGDRAVPAQGYDVNCPAYDLMHCILISFLRNTSPSQWRPGPECTKAREYASACPVCPDECFGAQVPNDSCHACLSLPRSA